MEGGTKGEKERRKKERRKERGEKQMRKREQENIGGDYFYHIMGKK
jgi:hypothetical protein